ncbi:MAG: DUF1385 domain-containing protein, partial [Oscillospiraceae bacterium]|nr:DUF1385 domain-containing protein [Oscillospiraceae bacterium]
MSKFHNNPTKFRTSIGGQALIEGILMRGPTKQAIVVNAPEGMVVKEEELRFSQNRSPVLKWFFIRGIVIFIGSLINGVKALSYSAEFFADEDTPQEPSKFEQWVEKHFGSEAAAKFVVGIAVFLGLVLAIGLFFVLPTFLVSPLTPVIPSHIVRNLIEGAIRIVIFLVYLILVSRTKDIKRVFSYHGAEHKTIFCYENGLDLTVENVRKQSRFHPRCGTSFLFVVLVLAILILSLVPWATVWFRLATRIICLPIIIGLSYELNRWIGRHDNGFSRVIRIPGLWLQNFTTNEPDDEMIAVGIKALELVIPEEKGADTW